MLKGKGAEMGREMAMPYRVSPGEDKNDEAVKLRRKDLSSRVRFFEFKEYSKKIFKIGTLHTKITKIGLRHACLLLVVQISSFL